MRDGDSEHKSGPMVLLLAVLALFGIRSIAPDSAAPSVGPPKAKENPLGREETESGGMENGIRDFVQPLEDFQDVRVPKDLHSKVERLTPELVKKTNARGLIVCVPDPLESSSGDRFDTVIDALLRAAESQHYVLDRYYYPWPRQKGAYKALPAGAVEIPSELAISLSFHNRTSRQVEERPWSRIPGLLLFRATTRRSDTPDGAVLLVLLVGETATAGIHKKAFATCLDILSHFPPDSPDGRVKVLGPCFSGSQASLEKVVREWTKPEGGNKAGFPSHFRIISGSATAIDKARLESDLSAAAPAPVGLEKRTTFHATVIPERHVIGALLRYLRLGEFKEGGFQVKQRERVAILYESNTAFGQEAMKDLLPPPTPASQKQGPGTGPGIVGAKHVEPAQKQQARVDPDAVGAGFAKPANVPRPLPEGVKSSTHPEPFSASGPAGRSPVPGPTLFPFPLHVSQVRAAYDKNSGATKDNTLRLPSFGSKLRLHLRGGENLRETEPSLHSTMTAVTTERILAHMLDTISHERFRYVFIVATDIKDRLFLGSLVREHCPESRLVFTDTDMLLAHPDFSADLRGSIVGSTYPLRSKTQTWSLPFQGQRTRLIFPGSREQGYYNAAVSLLDPTDTDALLDYGPPFPALYANQEDVKTTMPPVWISIIGEGGLYPLTAIAAKGERPYGGYVYRAKGKLPSRKAKLILRHTNLWIVPVLASILLLCYVGGAYGYVVGHFAKGKRGSAGDNSWEMSNLFWPRKFWGRRQRLYVLVCLTSALTVYAYLSFVWLIPFFYAWWLEMPFLQIIASDWTLLAIPLMLAPLLLMLLAWRFRNRFRTFICLALILTVYAYLAYICFIPLVHAGWFANDGTARRETGWTLPSILEVVGLFFLILLTRMLSPASCVRACLTSLGVVYAYLTYVWIFPFDPSSRDPNSLVEIPPGGWIMPRVLLVLALSFLILLAVRAGQFFRAGGVKTLWISLLGGIQSAWNMLGPVVPHFPDSLYHFAKRAWHSWLGLFLMSVFLLGIMADYYFMGQNRQPMPPETGELLLFSERAASLASGISPAVPVFMVGMALFCWAYFQLKRLFFLDKHTVKTPFPGGLSLLKFAPVREAVKETRKYLLDPLQVVNTEGAFLAWVILFYSFCRLSSHYIPAFDGVVTESLIFLGLAVLALLIVYTWLLFRKVWGGIRKLLRAITMLPLEEAFSRIPNTITAMFGPNLTSERPGRKGHLPYRQEQHHLLAVEYHRIATTLQTAAGLDPSQSDDLARTLPNPQVALYQANPRGLRAAAKVCLQLLHRVWNSPDLTARLLPKDPQTAEQKWLVRAQDFVALEVTVYLSQFFVQLRNMALFLSIAPLLLLLAVSSYPFQPQRLWVLLAVALIGLVTLSILWVAIQAERDELVSRIAKTTPNRLTFHWSFLSHLGLYAIPLLGILVAMSSDLSDLVHSWLDPLLQAMR